MAKTTDLDAAFRATTYRVFVPGGPFSLRIGEAHAGLAAWLQEHGHTGFAILSAWNPGAHAMPVTRNAERQTALACDLLEGNFVLHAGENVPDEDAGWREESCFVPDLAPEDACALGEAYGQSAVICGGTDGVPQLIWVSPQDA